MVAGGRGESRDPGARFIVLPRVRIPREAAVMEGGGGCVGEDCSSTCPSVIRRMRRLGRKKGGSVREDATPLAEDSHVALFVFFFMLHECETYEVMGTKRNLMNLLIG